MPRLDHFGLLAPIYERVIQPPEPDRLIRLLGLPVEGALLDAAGGTGRVAQAMRNLASPVVIADVSMGMLRQAAAKGRAAVACAHTERLPFPDETFQSIIMVDALHHVIHQQQTADELWRVLRPGGRIVIEDMDIRFAAVKLVALVEKMALMRSHFLSAEGIQSLFNHHPDAQRSVQFDGFTTWVIVDKLANAG